MLHVSFAMTTEAFADGTKTETRRFWKPAHALKFTPGTIFMGITKDFRAGGKCIHAARVVFCRQERLRDISYDSFLREGGTRYWRNHVHYIQVMGGPDKVPWVLRFEHLSAEEALKEIEKIGIARRIQKLRDGKGWCCVEPNSAFSRDGKSSVCFLSPTFEESALRCVEYCEWMNKQKGGK